MVDCSNIASYHNIMIVTVQSATVLGLTVVPVSVEVDVSSGGLPGLVIVGLPDKAVDESRERIRSAIRASGLTVPARRVTINLGPADLRKEGPGFDLPIAVAILAADGQIPEPPPGVQLIGELALNGTLRPVRGVLPIAAAAATAGVSGVFVPQPNALEAALVKGTIVYGPTSLRALTDHFTDPHQQIPAQTRPRLRGAEVPRPETDFADIKGQAAAKRILEIAAAGGHNVFLSGPPGTGKSLLAKALPGILPPLREPELLEVTGIWSVAGLLARDQAIVDTRPFRAPHHSISLPALVGGGSLPRPGEISLAHRGVLYLDELPQFAPSVLEAIRGPLEDRVVRVSRSRYASEFPSDCMLVASQNPCPCGFADDPDRPCTCTPAAVHRYRQRVSGPLRDRFDLWVGVPRIPYDQLTTTQPGETSAAVRQRVTAARLIQRQRYGHELGTNANLDPQRFERYCAVDTASADLIRMATERWHLSVRAVHRVLKVARTISDLADQADITAASVAEALSYRQPALTTA